MSPEAGQYDPRYLAGILFFNDQDFFTAHEVWEDPWAEAHGPERKFYQGLIQAAVGLCHFANGNLRGAVKLYHSARAYMEPCGSPFLGLDVAEFWRQMERCFAGLLAGPEPDRSLRPQADRLPVLRLDPPPAAWPDLAEYAADEDE
jgi:predicted metal-dependent hydrolase